MDWLPLIAGMLLVNAFLMVWCFTIMSNRVNMALVSLDSKIASAIAQVIAEGLPQIDQVNPIQAAIAQMLAKSASPALPQAVEVIRGEDGKFSSQ